MVSLFRFPKQGKAAPRAHSPKPGMRAWMIQAGKPVWTPRDYPRFADEAYVKNVIAYQSVHRIASAVSSVPWCVVDLRDRRTLTDHPLCRLLAHPQPHVPGTSWMESLVSYRLISGNSYVLRVGPDGVVPQELHLLRPDRVQVVAGSFCVPYGYRYEYQQNRFIDYPCDPVTGKSEILHLKTFHPLSDWYGLSPIEAAAYSIDQHNEAGSWNQALLQNGARPSGALVVKGGEGMGSHLSDEQYQRLKHQIDEQFSGAINAGRPMLLEGGLEWRDMSISPRDMDFINTKHSAARDIALAFGVPPQLLGIPGDNTYSNLAEARLAFWEQTIIPLLDSIRDAFNGWLTPLYPEPVTLKYDLDSVSALAPRREALWNRVNESTFLSEAEKRAMLGLEDL